MPDKAHYDEFGTTELRFGGKWTCPHCPVQAEGRLSDGRPWYFRARGGCWSLRVGEPEEEHAVNGHWVAEGLDPWDGFMPAGEAAARIHSALQWHVSPAHAAAFGCTEVGRPRVLSSGGVNPSCCANALRAAQPPTPSPLLRRCAVGERTEAQRQATDRFSMWKREGVRICKGAAAPLHRDHYAPAMRNAWVAYHAGAPWMRGVFDLFQELASAETKVDRLTAEVERLREHAEHDRETLTPLENAFEAVGGDLVDEVLGLRAEVARLRKSVTQAAAYLSKVGGYGGAHAALCVLHAAQEGVATDGDDAILEDALAREDGAS